MRFRDVHIEGVAHVLPEERVSSDALEERLGELYGRLRLRVGRLELMSGIRERRFFPPGTRPSAVASAAGEQVLEATGFDRARVGALVHASVCRDFMEPATASVVHARLGLAPACTVFDLSNACLGVANAMAVLAAQIERREIEAGLVVAGETGRPLVEETLAALRSNPDATKDDVKRAFASLTIGSGAAAVLLVHRDVATRAHRLEGGVCRAATQHHELCHGGVEAGRSGPLMETDSEALLLAGRDLARETWAAFHEELDWGGSADRVVTHQVGVAHRRAVLAALEVDPAIDYPTVETLGNIGSVSLPLSLSRASEDGFVRPDQRVALLGIGSGLHCFMLGVRW